MALTSPGLIKAANDALVGVSPDINMAGLFSVDFSADIADHGTTIKVPVVSATAADYSDSDNNFETDTGSLNYVDVVLNKHPKATFKAPRMAAFEAPNAPYWARVRTACANAVSTSISTALGGLFTTTNCKGGKVVFAEVSKASVAGLITGCKGRVAETILGLAPTEYAELLALLDTTAYGGAEAIRNGYIPSLYGFKAVICMRDLPTGVKGVLIPDTAVAIAARATVKDFAPFIEGDNVTDESGFPLTVTRHFSAAKREEFLNVDVLWGVALAQGAKVQYLAAS